MAVRGKNISVYLMDGDATGRMKATIANWTGVAYRIPRTALDLCKDRDDLKQSGVYFLFGIDDQSGDNVVYIGQAGARKNGEGVLNRLAEHKRNPDKDYWTEAVVFTTSNNSFGPTEISYLENRFCGMAQSAKRYIVKNENDPTHGNITEEKESELEEFVDFARLIMGVLGHKVFEPFISSSPESEAEPLLYLEYSGSKATGKRTSDGFVVLKGSTLNPQITKACPKRAIKDRNKYAELIDETYTLTADVLLSSPSAAASFVGGASLSGNFKWKDENGVSLGELEKMSK